MKQIPTWRDAKEQSDIRMSTEDWQADEIEALRVQLREVEAVVELARVVCQKFINKVQAGLARSVETYDDCQAVIGAYNEL